MCIYSPFHKTLPRSSAFVNWLSIRFYETGPALYYVQSVFKITLRFRMSTLKINFLVRNLHLRDLVDILNVYVDQSNVPMAGQGLFAKQFIEKGK